MKTLFVDLLDAVAGAGYGQWFLIMAMLHPQTLVLLWAGRVHRPVAVSRQ